MRMLFRILVLGALVLAGATFRAAGADRAHPEAIIAYVFPRAAVLRPGDVDAHAITRINFAFANIENGRMVEGSPLDAGNLAFLTGLREQNPSLQVVVSVGGWLWSGGFSDVALTTASRQAFIQSVADFLNRYNLDGLDVDWEYPGMPGAGHGFRAEDKHNFTLLLKELRTRLDAEGKRAKRRMVLSIAAGASDDFIEHTEMAELQRYVDDVNVMSYDYYEQGVDATTGHHAPLFANPADPKRVSADASVKAFERVGVPARKLVLGVPFYGRVWGNVAATADGLYQPGKEVPNAFAPFSAIESSMLGSGYTRYWDATAMAPWLYNASTERFVSYEDEQSIAAKCRYVRARGLAGIMFWSYGDDSGGKLLRAIDEGLR